MNTDKYKSILKAESPLDYCFYFPLSDFLLKPLHCLGFTPNGITYLSIITSIISSYLLHKNKILYSIILLHISYLFDSIDGKFARKYNMTSDFGMKLDIVSDNITYFILFIVLLRKINLNPKIIALIGIVYYFNIKWHGLNEAIECYNKHNHDNFYKVNYDKFKDDKSLLNKLFLFTYKSSYKFYKSSFPKFDKEKITKKLLFCRYFGPGSIPLFFSLIFLYSRTS